MIRTTFPAMGTTIILVGRDQARLDRARARILEIEAVCTRFDDTSELSRLNRRPAGHVELSPLLRDVLTVAADLEEKTGGIFDPAVGERVIAWGYDRTYEQVRDVPIAPEATEQGTWFVTSSGVHREPGVTIDLGGIAKGWACDQVVEAGLVELASAGGDMRSTHADAIAELIDPAGSTVAARIDVGVGAVATSSTYNRSWSAGDIAAHHIIDPATGRPAATPVVTSTVTAATAAEAEAAAKTALILGTEGLAWCDRTAWVRGGAAIWNTGAVYATGSLDLLELTA